MKYRSGVYVLAALLTAMPAFAQSAWLSLMDRGNELRRTGNYTEAADAYREAVRIAEQPGSPPLQLASALNSLGVAYDDLGRLSDAENQYRRALATIEGIAGRQSVSWAQTLVNMSGVYLHRGELAKAEAMLRDALATYSRLPSSVDRLLLAEAQSCLTETLLDKGEYKEAEQLANQALAVFEKVPERGDGYLGTGFNNLGVVRRYQGRHEEAIQLFERSVATFEAYTGFEHPVLIRPLNNLGVAYTQMGRGHDAEDAFRRAVLIAEKQLGTAHPVYGTILMNYAQCVKKAGRKAEAKTLETRAKAVLRDSARVAGTGMTVDVSAFRQK
jgi:tetratricopeptide (TPR) repeat protein